jgi:hypothetical protein
MAFAYVFEWDTEDRRTDGFDAVVAHTRMLDDPPPGLLSVAAGHTDAGSFRIFEVWETASDRDEFERTRLTGAVEAVPDASGGAPHRESSYELHLFSSEVPA